MAYRIVDLGKILVSCCGRRTRQRHNVSLSIFLSIPLRPSITQDKSITACIPPAAVRRILCHDPIGRWRDPIQCHVARRRNAALRGALTNRKARLADRARWMTRLNQLPEHSSHSDGRLLRSVGASCSSGHAKNFVFGSWAGMLSVLRIWSWHLTCQVASNIRKSLFESWSRINWVYFRL